MLTNSFGTKHLPTTSHSRHKFRWCSPACSAYYHNKNVETCCRCCSFQGRYAQTKLYVMAFESSTFNTHRVEHWHHHSNSRRCIFRSFTREKETPQSQCVLSSIQCILRSSHSFQLDIVYSQPADTGTGTNVNTQLVYAVNHLKVSSYPSPARVHP